MTATRSQATKDRRETLVSLQLDVLPERLPRNRSELFQSRTAQAVVDELARQSANFRYQSMNIDNENQCARVELTERALK
jgi:hypothetical protein